MPVAADAADAVAIRQVPPPNAQLPLPNQKTQILEGLDTEYLIGPMDMVDIKVVGFPEFGGLAQVDFSGRLQLPLVGSIMAAGKSLDELSHDLQLAYDRTYLKRPRVSASLKEVKSRFITVEGQVKQPGLYPVPTQLSLLSAISLAEGVTEFAKLSRVAVFRTVDDKRYAAIFDLNDIRKGIYGDPVIRHGDVIVVGNSSVRRLFRDIVQTAPFVAVFRPFG